MAEDQRLYWLRDATSGPKRPKRLCDFQRKCYRIRHSQLKKRMAVQLPSPSLKEQGDCGGGQKGDK